MVGIPTIGLFFYNCSSAVDVRALMSRGRRANPVLTYETALRRFFAYGGVLRRWGIPGSRLYNRSSAVFAYGGVLRRGVQSSLRRFFRIAPMGASCRNEVFVMRLFCVGFCKIGK